jgi:hypothetical protein
MKFCAIYICISDSLNKKKGVLEYALRKPNKTCIQSFVYFLLKNLKFQIYM